MAALLAVLLVALLRSLLIVLRELFELALQFFRIAPQQLLLPAVLKALRAVVALLIGQLLLAPRQFIELLERVVDLLVAWGVAAPAVCAVSY